MTFQRSKPRLRVVVPVYNDWTSFGVLLQRLDAVAAELGYRVSVSAVDDGSTEAAAGVEEVAAGLVNLAGVEIVRLALNVGHQRAIAVGLCVAHDDGDFDVLLVMDSDGEDPPEALPRLLACAGEEGEEEEFCIVAARGKRSEQFAFRASYVVYKTIFKVVTGKSIGFGNFSMFSAGYVARLVMISDLWNNLPAAILRSRLPIRMVAVDRGKRYSGRSQMNFTSLVVHGFSAISVYAETIFVRLLVSGIVLALLTVTAVVGTVALRLFFPTHATPGWATTVSFGMTIILVQVLFTTLMSILMLLNSRVQRLVIPIVDYKPYVRARQKLRDASMSLVGQV